MAGFAFAPPNPTEQVDSKTRIDEKVDYSNLPCPNPYEDIHLEATKSLKPELFEGFRFDYNKKMNQKFSLCHSLMMGPTEVPWNPTLIVKIPASSYEFGASFIDPKLMLVGTLMTDGTLTVKVKGDLTDNFTIKTNAELTNELDKSQGVFTFDYKGSDYRTQLQLGNHENQFERGTSSLFRANYIQHVTPKLSLGGEVLWLGEQQKSVVGYAARYETDKMVASGQVASSGVAIMNYVHKVTEKVSLAADFFYNFMLRDGGASVGYDYMFSESRVRAKIDSNGVVSTHVENQLFPGLGLLLSAEVDHVKKDYKFGLGVKFEYPPSQ